MPSASRLRAGDAHRPVPDDRRDHAGRRFARLLPGLSGGGFPLGSTRQVRRRLRLAGVDAARLPGSEQSDRRNRTPTGPSRCSKASSKTARTWACRPSPAACSPISSSRRRTGWPRRRSSTTAAKRSQRPNPRRTAPSLIPAPTRPDGSFILTRISSKIGSPDQSRAQQARELLDQARADVEAKNILDSLQRSDAIIATFGDLPEAAEAKKLIASIKANPEQVARRARR